MKILTSTRLEVLAAELCRRVAAAPLDPLENETIVVHSQATARWLTLELAREHGIAASLDFPLPRRFCHELADRVLGAAESGAAGRGFDRDAMGWAIYADMEEWAALGELREAATYLADDFDQRKRYQLSRRVAALFEAYQVYRHDVLLGWESKGHVTAGPESWQAPLWRRLVARTPAEQSLACRLAALIERLEHSSPGSLDLPRRVSAFGIVRLAPVILRLLEALGRWIPVDLYIVSPTPEYWGDVLTEKDASRLAARRDVEAVGNELLASWSKQGREFFNLLQQVDESGEAWNALEFVDPGRDSSLHVLQSDVFALASRRDSATAPWQVSEEDASLEIHVCHSRLREIEVLSDRLLDAFAGDPHLRPDQVIVLVPDLRGYAPYIEAVFGSARESDPRIPFRIAERFPTDDASGAAALLALLDLVDARASSSEVLALLDVPGVCRRFDIRQAEIEAIVDLLQAAGVCWGLDGEHRRKAFGLPEEEANSWRAGLDRLLMGYATGGGSETLVGGIAPQASGDADLLCRMMAFLDCVFSLLGLLRAARPAARWAEDLSAAFDRLYLAADQEEEQQLGRVRAAIGYFGDLESILGELPLSRTVMRTAIEERLSSAGPASGFSSGAVTFCSFEPMRAIPARLICMVGLDAESFPRTAPYSRIDLMTRSPRPCDRSHGRDDRQTFLENFLAVRQRLLISYCGYSTADAKAIAPSAVVDELLEQIDCSFVAEGYERARDRFLIHQPLHAFDPRCFDPSDSQRWSFRSQNCLPQLGDATSRPVGIPFVVGELDVQTPEEIDLSDLIEFWSHPSRYFCRQVLGMRLARDEDSPDEEEPFGLDTLDRYDLAQWMVGRRLRAEAVENGEEGLLRAMGRLPIGVFGSSVYAKLREDVSAQLERIGRPRPLDPVPVRIEGRRWTLSGVIEPLTDLGLLSWRYASVNLKQLAPAWIKLLALSESKAADAGDMPLQARIVGRRPSDDWCLVLSEAWRDEHRAAALLETMVDGYRIGRRRPLPFFPTASLAVAELLSKKENEDRVREVAIRKYRGSENYSKAADLGDVYIAQCFRGCEVFDEQFDEFCRWAEVFCKPLFEAAEKT